MIADKEFVILFNICISELLLATTFLPFTSQDEALDPDKAMNDENYRLSFYKSPKFIEEVRPLLKYFLRRGFLD